MNGCAATAAFVCFVIAGTLLFTSFGWMMQGNPVGIAIWVLFAGSMFYFGRIRKRNQS